MLKRISTLLLLLALLSACKSSAGAPAYNISDITGRLKAAGLTVLSQESPRQDLFTSAPLYEITVQVGRQQATVTVCLFPSPDDVPLDQMAPKWTSIWEQESQERFYQSHSAVVYIPTRVEEVKAMIRKALPPTKTFHTPK